MNEKTILKDELLNMLAEIADQLEDLENILEANLAKARQNATDNHLENLKDCENKITALERKIDKKQTSDEEMYLSNGLNRKKGLKLELGF
ncbi:flagellar motility protein MotE (MotC chaperone) [Cytobacillus eiseniae]|uniref:Flagellar motility protein MotE (MotC chaperone) n=1 Tax=Cytobacillus eiseniae TaxID=762947 RepID=A0ABS4REK3_9BACI|nr:hypothetical protein [Cytobacillus eiseniae]MBP2241336.1 flagellar motility protein MotE (MotC chaperone) [Cytobacillus eiseniae]